MTSKDKEPTWVILSSGAVAGALSRTVTAPLDRLKVIMQTQYKQKNPNYQQNVFKCLVNMYYENGSFLCYFKGNGTNVLKIAPEIGLKFLFFERVNSVMNSNNQFTMRMLSGAVAGSSTQVIIYPLEIVKTRLALNKLKKRVSIYNCVRDIVNSHGFTGLYRGMGASLLGIIPYTAVDLSIYSYLRDKYIYKNDQNHQTNLQTNSNNQQQFGSAYIMLLCGAVSSCIGQFISYPFAIVKTKLQVQGMKGFEHFRFDGIVDCIVKIYQHESIPGFYKGIIPNFLKNIPAVSISYMVFEKTKIMLKKHYNI